MARTTNWTPSVTKIIVDYIDKVKKDFTSCLNREYQKNFSKKEIEAIKNLMNNDSIIIRPSDKGSNIVIMNTEDYRSLILKNLECVNDCPYKKVDESFFKKSQNKIKKTLNDLEKDNKISKELKNNLLMKNSNAGKVQGNPKIHKNDEDVRLVINSRNHPTEKIAQYIEDQLNNNVIKQNTYIKDTSHLIKELANINLPKDKKFIMFCMDVKALYPSVPREEARAAASLALESRTDLQTDIETMLKLMDMVLENNVFCFDKNYYVQTEGTAMDLS